MRMERRSPSIVDQDQPYIPFDPEDIYQSVVIQQPNLGDIPRGEALSVIENGLDDLCILETAAIANYPNPNITPQIAENLDIAWVLSGPGTRYEPSKNDAYQDFRWADGMDRARQNYAVRVARGVAEVRSGQNFNSGALDTLPERKRMINELVATFGPDIIYNGIPVENAAVREAMTEEGLIIPQSKVHVIGEGIKRTIDQVTGFEIPKGIILGPNSEIGIVSHAPHLMRTAHMIEMHKPFPEGTRVRMLPLPSPVIGRREYTELEIRGLMYYTFINGNASVNGCEFSTLPA